MVLPFLAEYILGTGINFKRYHITSLNIRCAFNLFHANDGKRDITLYLSKLNKEKHNSRYQSRKLDQDINPINKNIIYFGLLKKKTFHYIPVRVIIFVTFELCYLFYLLHELCYHFLKSL